MLPDADCFKRPYIRCNRYCQSLVATKDGTSCQEFLDIQNERKKEGRMKMAGLATDIAMMGFFDEESDD